MKRTKLEYLVKGTEGELYAFADGGAYDSVTSVAIDSRNISDETLFFCIIGNRVDGHDFLDDVRERGCHNVVLSDANWAEKMKAHGDMNVILVSDTRRALMELAERYLDDWPELIRVAVTGSVGKTTTKELVYSVLSSSFRSGKTIGNLNSEYGLPLTAFAFEEDIEVAVIEMGAGDTSRIEELSKIAKPDVAVITTIGTSHMEFFGDREGLAREKLSVTKWMKDGVIIVNSDCDMLSEEKVADIVGSEVEIRTVGTGDDADYEIYDVDESRIDEVIFKIDSSLCGDDDGENKGRAFEVKVPLGGVHNALNAGLAIAAGEVLGVDIGTASEAVSEIEHNSNRMDIIESNGITVINDTYNASPESMKAALHILSNSEADKKVAILGSMFELGESYVELHKGVGRACVSEGVDLLVTIGDEAAYIAEGAREELLKRNCETENGDGRGSCGDSEALIEIRSYTSKADALADLDNLVREGDIVLVKASRSMGLEEISHKIGSGNSDN